MYVTRDPYLRRMIGGVVYYFCHGRSLFALTLIDFEIMWPAKPPLCILYDRAQPATYTFYSSHTKYMALAISLV